MVLLDELAPLDPFGDLAIAEGPRRRKTSKQPPAGAVMVKMKKDEKDEKQEKPKKPKAKAKAKTKAKAKAKTKAKAKAKTKQKRRVAIEDDDDDDEEGGEDNSDDQIGEDKAKASAKHVRKMEDCDDDDDDDEGGEDTSDDMSSEDKAEGEMEVDEGECKGNDEGECKGNEGDKEEAQVRAEEAKPKQKPCRRDQSKNKKFMEIFNELPTSLQEHFQKLNRADATAFVNAGICREGRHLHVDHEAMFKLQLAREEKQKGKEKMLGYIYEDHSEDLSRQPPPHPPIPPTPFYKNNQPTFPTRHLTFHH